MNKYIYTGNSSFKDAYYDCKLVHDSIVDAESFQNADTGLILYCMDRVLEALEKQIPKKVKKPNRFPSDVKCPNGCMLYDTYAVDYCDKCGQKLEWY